MWPTRGLGSPFLWATAGLGRRQEVGLTATAAQRQDASGQLQAKASSGYPIRRYPEPTRPPRRLTLTGSADQAQDAVGSLTLVARPSAAAAQVSAVDSRVAAAFTVSGSAQAFALAHSENQIVLNPDEAELEALLLLV